MTSKSLFARLFDILPTAGQYDPSVYRQGHDGLSQSAVGSKVDRYLAAKTSPESASMTGVGRYLMQKYPEVAVAPAPSEQSSVSRYIQEKQRQAEQVEQRRMSQAAEIVAEVPRPVVETVPEPISRVARYLKEKQSRHDAEPALTRVDQYQLKKNLVKEKVRTETSVSGYLRKQSHSGRPATTKVGKYLSKQLTDEERSQTTVSKYLAKKVLQQKSNTRVNQYLAKQLLAPKGWDSRTRVERYVQTREAQNKDKSGALTRVEKMVLEQEKTAIKARAEAIVARYLALEAEKKDSAVTATAAEPALEQQIAELSGTRVEIYSGKKTLLASGRPTGVARYWAKKLAAHHAKGPATRVEKYLARQLLAAVKIPKKTRVEHYLDRQQLKAALHPGATRVERYLAKQTVVASQHAPISNVARYLLNKQDQQEPVTGVVKYLIRKLTRPAAPLYGVTGVESYIRKQRPVG